MLIFSGHSGLFMVDGGAAYLLEGNWDELFTADDPAEWVQRQTRGPVDGRGTPGISERREAPLGHQEVWAAGVTYRRSCEARIQESLKTGGASHYDRVYGATRPELFFKANPHRVVGPGQNVRIRRDSKWNVPEPELTLAINRSGRIFGYTIGNDMSSRDIEAENPLYLPQAKIYSGCCALGPAVLIDEKPLNPDTSIELVIRRKGKEVFRGQTHLSEMKRSWKSLVDYLLRDNHFPFGCYLMTGTGIVPPDDFTLQEADEINITIEPIGTLTNRVAV
ncbi:MAG: fumarylacetoacetate hydrolase family protein [Phycisphaeraceae bacterium]|nr:fumarylacetoacetate hydrolase family protein [Phycisphaeraceae bacterium]